ncbi:MAG: DUF3817 domain-containing protein [Flavobacteriaceae bacterium]|nr:DUF3817 domain-containing protein [Flavobacteriaceae bacterium]
MLTIFKITAFLEGVSYLLLLFIATPIKYVLDDPQYVKLLGMPHGILFVLYLVLVIMLRMEHSWFKSNFLYALLMAIVPFGTFILDKKLKKETT